MLRLSALLLLIFTCLCAQTEFEHELKGEKVPWSSKDFANSPNDFQFAIVSDRTGGMRAGVFAKAAHKLNLLNPEFVLSVGDLIDGYTEDDAILTRQWVEFDSILTTLDMRFFPLPGNHDISNHYMRKLWLDRYGYSYYGFRYKDVLFCLLDTNEGEGEDLSPAQIDYFIALLNEKKPLRHIFVLMHHPLWQVENEQFGRFEEELSRHPYTVIAGHQHRYFKTQRQKRNYYVLATTGGGSRLRGPRLGEFDHVTWVSMVGNTPELVNLTLDGIISDDVLSDANALLALSLYQAAEIEQLWLSESAKQHRLVLQIYNRLGEKPDPGLLLLSSSPGAVAPLRLHWQGEFFHHHQLHPVLAQQDVSIAAGTTEQIVIPVNGLLGGENAPLELDYELAYASPSLDPPYLLSGRLAIPVTSTNAGIRLSQPNIFLQSATIDLQSAFSGMEILYTLDGSEPDHSAALWQGPLTLQKSTTINARLRLSGSRALGPVVSQTYRQTEAMSPAPVDASRLRPGLRYQYYEANLKALPDFNTLQAQNSGISRTLALESIRQRDDQYAVLFSGYIRVREAGIYTFSLRSDDGTRLFIGEQLLIDNDGSHAPRTRTNYIALAAGLHQFRLEYFEDFGGEYLGLSLGLDGKLAPVSAEQLLH
jgi:hypothetical protein